MFNLIKYKLAKRLVIQKYNFSCSTDYLYNMAKCHFDYLQFAKDQIMTHLKTIYTTQPNNSLESMVIDHFKYNFKEYQKGINESKLKLNELFSKYGFKCKVYKTLLKHKKLNKDISHDVKTLCAYYKDLKVKYERDYKYFDYNNEVKKILIKQKLKSLESDFD